MALEADLFIRDLLERLGATDWLGQATLRAGLEPRDERKAPAVSGTIVSDPWSAARLAVTDGLWGEGFFQPGGAEEIQLLARPLGLTPAHSLLLVGSDSGGPPRCLAAGLGCWVSAFASNPALVELSAARCASAGLGKRVTLSLWSRENPAFPERYFQRALALDPFEQGKPAAVIPALVRALKPDGELVMTAVVAGPAAATARLDAWQAAELRSAPPAEEAELCRLLEGAGHEVRVAKDETVRHVQLAVRQWHEFVTALKADRPDPVRARQIVAEAERWLLRARLMRAGAIRMMRFHSIGRAGG